MSDEDQKKLALSIDPELDVSGCYNDIMKRLNLERFLRILDDERVPKDMRSCWAYEWALRIGDREIMIDRVTDSKWAYRWARSIGDRELMKQRFPEESKGWVFLI